jgi:hypothetical protein
MNPSAEIEDVAGKEGTHTITVMVTYENGARRIPMRFDFEPPLPGDLSPQDVVAKELRKMRDALEYLANTEDGRKQIRWRSRPQP